MKTRDCQLRLLFLEVQRGPSVCQFLYQTVDPVQGRRVGDARRHVRLVGNLVFYFCTLSAHESPQNQGGSLQHSQSPIIAKNGAVMAVS